MGAQQVSPIYIDLKEVIAFPLVERQYFLGTRMTNKADKHPVKRSIRAKFWS